MPLPKLTEPFLIAGPCSLESMEVALEVGREVAAVSGRLGLPAVFKGSWDKANRTSARSYRGVGLERGLEILRAVGEETGLPLLTDVHEPAQAGPVAEVVDILQVPAFLCRQTDLLAACGQSGRAVQVKKGQFMHPDDMAHAVEKVALGGDVPVLLCERGTSFGYRNLVVDMRSIPLLAKHGTVVFDATHSVQLPSGAGGKSGGQREFVAPLARAALAAGATGLFLETHPRPDEALSDGPNMVPLAGLEALLADLLGVWR